MKKLSALTVQRIRESTLTDRWWSDHLHVGIKTISAARTGMSHRDVLTKPDTNPRDATGSTHALRRGDPQPAVPRKQRREWKS